MRGGVGGGLALLLSLLLRLLLRREGAWRRGRELHVHCKVISPRQGVKGESERGGGEEGASPGLAIYSDGLNAQLKVPRC